MSTGREGEGTSGCAERGCTLRKLTNRRSNVCLHSSEGSFGSEGGGRFASAASTSIEGNLYGLSTRVWFGSRLASRLRKAAENVQGNIRP